MDAGIYNVKKATCGWRCEYCSGASDWWIVDDPFAVALSQNHQLTYWVQMHGGGQHDYTSGSDWSSTNNGVATVSTGLVHGASAGTATIDAYIDLAIYGQVCGGAPECPFDDGLQAGSPGTVQIPTASRIQSALLNIQLTSGAGCPTGQNGWDRQVQKLVTDQNGLDIVLGGQNLSETVTITHNGLNLGTPQTGNATTNGSGFFTDTFFFCSALCPGGGETDATQGIDDTLPGGAGPYHLSPNALVYKCTGITVNGQ